MSSETTGQDGRFKEWSQILSASTTNSSASVLLGALDEATPLSLCHPHQPSSSTICSRSLNTTTEAEQRLVQCFLQQPLLTFLMLLATEVMGGEDNDVYNNANDSNAAKDTADSDHATSSAAVAQLLRRCASGLRTTTNNDLMIENTATASTSTPPPQAAGTNSSLFNTLRNCLQRAIRGGGESLVCCTDDGASWHEGPVPLTLLAMRLLLARSVAMRCRPDGEGNSRRMRNNDEKDESPVDYYGYFCRSTNQNGCNSAPTGAAGAMAFVDGSGGVGAPPLPEVTDPLPLAVPPALVSSIAARAGLMAQKGNNMNSNKRRADDDEEEEATAIGALARLLSLVFSRGPLNSSNRGGGVGGSSQHNAEYPDRHATLLPIPLPDSRTALVIVKGLLQCTGRVLNALCAPDRCGAVLLPDHPNSKAPPYSSGATSHLLSATDPRDVHRLTSPPPSLQPDGGTGAGTDAHWEAAMVSAACTASNDNAQQARNHLRYAPPDPLVQMHAGGRCMVAVHESMSYPLTLSDALRAPAEGLGSAASGGGASGTGGAVPSSPAGPSATSSLRPSTLRRREARAEELARKREARSTFTWIDVVGHWIEEDDVLLAAALMDSDSSSSSSSSDSDMGRTKRRRVGLGALGGRDHSSPSPRSSTSSSSSSSSSGSSRGGGEKNSRHPPVIARRIARHRRRYRRNLKDRRAALRQSAKAEYEREQVRVRTLIDAIAGNNKSAVRTSGASGLSEATPTLSSQKAPTATSSGGKGGGKAAGPLTVGGYLRRLYGTNPLQIDPLPLVLKRLERQLGIVLPLRLLVRAAQGDSSDSSGDERLLDYYNAGSDDSLSDDDGSSSSGSGSSRTTATSGGGSRNASFRRGGAGGGATSFSHSPFAPAKDELDAADIRPPVTTPPAAGGGRQRSLSSSSSSPSDSDAYSSGFSSVFSSVTSSSGTSSSSSSRGSSASQQRRRQKRKGRGNKREPSAGTATTMNVATTTVVKSSSSSRMGGPARDQDVEDDALTGPLPSTTATLGSINDGSDSSSRAVLPLINLSMAQESGASSADRAKKREQTRERLVERRRLRDARRQQKAKEALLLAGLNPFNRLGALGGSTLRDGGGGGGRHVHFKGEGSGDYSGKTTGRPSKNASLAASMTQQPSPHNQSTGGGRSARSAPSTDPDGPLESQQSNSAMLGDNLNGGQMSSRSSTGPGPGWDVVESADFTLTASFSSEQQARRRRQQQREERRARQREERRRRGTDQHVFIITTARPLLSDADRLQLFPPAGSEQFHARAKENKDFMTLALDRLLRGEEADGGQAAVAEAVSVVTGIAKSTFLSKANATLTGGASSSGVLHTIRRLGGLGGASADMAYLRNELQRHRRSAVADGRYTEQWVCWLDVRRQILVTVRPTDCYSVAVLRDRFKTLFGAVACLPNMFPHNTTATAATDPLKSPPPQSPVLSTSGGGHLKGGGGTVVVSGSNKRQKVVHRANAALVTAQFRRLVWLLSEASLLNYRPYLTDMDRIVDEAERLIAPAAQFAVASETGKFLLHHVGADMMRFMRRRKAAAAAAENGGDTHAALKGRMASLLREEENTAGGRRGRGTSDTWSDAGGSGYGSSAPSSRVNSRRSSLTAPLLGADTIAVTTKASNTAASSSSAASSAVPIAYGGCGREDLSRMQLESSPRLNALHAPNRRRPTTGSGGRGDVAAAEASGDDVLYDSHIEDLDERRRSLERRKHPFRTVGHSMPPAPRRSLPVVATVVGDGGASSDSDDGRLGGSFRRRRRQGSFWASLVGVLTRMYRSLRRKLARTRRLPVDVLFSAIRLLNIVRVMTTAYDRAVCELPDKTFPSLHRVLDVAASASQHRHHRGHGHHHGHSHGTGHEHEHEHVSHAGDTLQRFLTSAGSFGLRSAASRSCEAACAASPTTALPNAGGAPPPVDIVTAIRSHNAANIAAIENDCRQISVLYHEQMRTGRHTSTELVNLSASIQGGFYDTCLAVVAITQAVFVPATFWATFFGMNFIVTPEFLWSNGYGYAWALMLGSCLLTLIGMRYIGVI